jgi:hypothetical protein
MKIFIAQKSGDLTLHKGKSIVIEFDDGETLELAESPEHLPPSIPDGVYVWGGREPSEETARVKESQVNITPVAANGIIVAPGCEKPASSTGMAMFIFDENGHLLPLKDKNVVIELNNGKTLEVREDYARKGLLVWGGREPIPGLPREKAKERTECLGIYPVGANVVHVFPFKLE